MLTLLGVSGLSQQFHGLEFEFSNDGVILSNSTDHDMFAVFGKGEEEKIVPIAPGEEETVELEGEYDLTVRHVFEVATIGVLYVFGIPLGAVHMEDEIVACNGHTTKFSVTKTTEQAVS